ncbi:hypothetical protein [Aureitalea marina]|uniref:DUF1566 domain-containing protein n=1 Tax=Aureitalea marina TaxID=930804 RepID=A0A2S7KS00_9FLAO|nr:hypothetical protein [Aureitalea marina]PQB05358.1 hypothetical protein BST85_11020 [Aureitalea marina]
MKKVFTLILIVLTFSSVRAQIGINTTTPADGAILDISSSDKGVMFPNIALSSRDVEAPVTEPTHGIFVFNTATAGTGDMAVTPGYYWWDDTISEWVRFTSGEDGNHYVGELYGGGVVFYVYENGKHGLIASLDDLSSGGDYTLEWGPNFTDTDSQSWWDGATNTSIANSNSPVANDAVKVCEDYVAPDGTSDWHLPSIGELKALEDAAYVLFKVLDTDGDSSTNGPDYSSRYWSSTSISSWGPTVLTFPIRIPMQRAEAMIIA